MKKFLLALAALPVAAMAVPATAQTYANTDMNVRLQNRILNLEARLGAAANAGVLTHRERASLIGQMNQLRALHSQYSYNGLTAAERRTLQQRIRTVRDQLRMAGGNGWARGYGWSDTELDVYAGGYGNAYGNAYNYGAQAYTVDQYGRRLPTTGYVYDQYGRAIPNTGYYGQGGPYEPVPRSNGVGNILGGVLGGVLGGGGGGVGGLLGSILGNGGLGIGDLVTGSIGSVLGRGSNYGYQDRSNVYFRSDGQRVYEIDARTNQVIRIHPLR